MLFQFQLIIALNVTGTIIASITRLKTSKFTVNSSLPCYSVQGYYPTSFLYLTYFNNFSVILRLLLEHAITLLQLLNYEEEEEEDKC